MSWGETLEYCAYIDRRNRGVKAWALACKKHIEDENK